MKNGNETEKF